MADENASEVRVLLDLRFRPDDPNSFVPDLVMEALDGAGSIGQVDLLWAGSPDDPPGNVPWPRVPDGDEQAQTDAALTQIEEEAKPPKGKSKPQVPQPDPDEVIVGTGEDQSTDEVDGADEEWHKAQAEPEEAPAKKASVAKKATKKK